MPRRCHSTSGLQKHPAGRLASHARDWRPAASLGSSTPRASGSCPRRLDGSDARCLPAPFLPAMSLSAPRRTLNQPPCQWIACSLLQPTRLDRQQALLGTARWHLAASQPPTHQAGPAAWPLHTNDTTRRRCGRDSRSRHVAPVLAQAQFRRRPWARLSGSCLARLMLGRLPGSSPAAFPDAVACLPPRPAPPRPALLVVMGMW
jgi:hypothetical protein